MATITYELGNPKHDRSRKISIVLSHKGQRRRLPINLSVAEKDLTKGGKIKASSIMRVLDARLSSLKGKLYDLEENGDSADIDTLYSRLTGSHEKLDFFEYVEHWIEKSRNKGKGNYKVMLNSVKRFYRYDTLPFSKIDYRFLDDYKEYLCKHPRAQSLYLAQL